MYLIFVISRLICYATYEHFVYMLYTDNIAAVFTLIFTCLFYIVYCITCSVPEFAIYSFNLFVSIVLVIVYFIYFISSYERMKMVIIIETIKTLLKCSSIGLHRIDINYTCYSIMCYYSC